MEILLHLIILTLFSMQVGENGVLLNTYELSPISVLIAMMFACADSISVGHGLIRLSSCHLVDPPNGEAVLALYS